MLYINGDFSAIDTTIACDAVDFVGGTSTLTGSTWAVSGNATATSGVTFATNSFSSSNWSIGGNFSFVGAAGNRLNLVANLPWELAVQGSASASHVDVSNSDAVGSQVIADDATSIDHGSNSNWLFFIPVSGSAAIVCPTIVTATASVKKAGTLYIDSNFSAIDTLVSCSAVDFVGGTSNLNDSTWVVANDATATSGVTFATDSFAGSHWTIGGDFSFVGDIEQHLNLVSSRAWSLAIQGSASASYVDVSNSDASGGSEVIADDGTSVDDGSNSNWLFGVPISVFVQINTRVSATATVVSGQVVPTRKGRPYDLGWTDAITGAVAVVSNVGYRRSIKIKFAFRESIYHDEKFVRNDFDVILRDGIEADPTYVGPSIKLKDRVKGIGLLREGLKIKGHVVSTPGPGPRVRLKTKLVH